MLTKETLVDLNEKFAKIQKLIEEDSRFDPETQPFFSKYQARQQLLSMNTLLDGLRVQSVPSHQIYNKIIGMQGAVQLQLGIIAYDTEEVAIAEQHFNECLQIIDKYKFEQEVASVALNLYNQLGILKAKSEQEIGQQYLEQAESFYKAAKEAEIIPIDYFDLFNHRDDNELDDAVMLEKFEKTYTLTLYYLAQVYGTINQLKSAVYCHRTLQRQLEMKDYDRIDWALNTATLSQYFMEKNYFKQARHHLCASSYMLKEHRRVLDAVENQDDCFDAQMEVYKHRSADVARCWIKYGLNLLQSSKERLMNSGEPINFTDILRCDCVEDTDFRFATLDLSELENQITDTFVLTLEDAKQVFIYTQKWVQRAHDYYALDSLASDYIEISQDFSKLYDMLSFYDECVENRMKMYKRACDILEKLLVDVNSKYYMEYCRDNWFRLGSLYSDILDLKLDKLKESKERPTPHALNKINMLVDKSIKNFQSFLDSFTKDPAEVITKLPTNFERAYLQALFHIGALWTRYITLDKMKQVENVRHSLSYYKKFVALSKLCDNADDLVGAELQVAKEMCTLLPLKIERLQRDLPPPIELDLQLEA